MPTPETTPREIGPTEDDDTISYGEGWHVMLTALGQ